MGRRGPVPNDANMMFVFFGGPFLPADLVHEKMLCKHGPWCNGVTSQAQNDRLDLGFRVSGFRL